MNTSKNLNRAEKIVKNLRMEVILKLDGVTLALEDLSKEEKAAWIDSLESHMSSALDLCQTREKAFREAVGRSKRYAEEIRELIKCYKHNPDFDILGAITKLNKKEYKRGTSLYEELRAAEIRLIGLPPLHVSGPTNCSLLIAKRGENVLRYVSILDSNDPVVTITGPNAKSLLEASRKKF